MIKYMSGELNYCYYHMTNQIKYLELSSNRKLVVQIGLELDSFQIDFPHS